MGQEPPPPPPSEPLKLTAEGLRAIGQELLLLLLLPVAPLKLAAEGLGALALKPLMEQQPPPPPPLAPLKLTAEGLGLKPSCEGRSSSSRAPSTALVVYACGVLTDAPLATDALPDVAGTLTDALPPTGTLPAVAGAFCASVA